MADKSGYRKLAIEQAKILLEGISAEFDGDTEEHGGASGTPNLAKWLDRTRKLITQIDELSKGWNRAQVEDINQSSRNAITYGDPKESAYFALYKDIIHEAKKLRKQGV